MAASGVKSGSLLPAAAMAWSAALLGRLRQRLDRDADRCILWLPAAFGLGVIAYLVPAGEPPWWLGLALLAASMAAAAGAMLARPGCAGCLAAAILAIAAALGFGAAQWQVASLSDPVLARRVGPARVSGQVVDLDARLPGFRVVLDRPVIAGLPPAETPRRVRLRLPAAAGRPVPGEVITVRAVIGPAPMPAMPGAFDPQRQAFFQGIGGVGYAIGPVLERRMGEGGWWLALATLRDHVQARIEAAFGTDREARIRAAMTAALFTGKQGGIPEDVMTAMRDSGLAHLLAISGMNIGLAAIFVFAVIRALLALVPPVALRLDTKKLAATVAVCIAFFYLLLSGSSVPALRSFVMLALSLVAILVGRLSVSMRPVAWAALGVMAAAPDSVLGASFQLSFAAVAALVATYEALRDRRRRRIAAGAWPARRTWGWMALLYLGGVALTSAVATAATTPFSIYHFNRFPVYGLLANMVAVPISSFWIMPAALVAMLLLPFGLEGWALGPMGAGVGAMLAVAREVAAWPGAVWPVPAMPDAGLALIVLGGLWLVIWRGGWRLWGLPAIALGLGSLFLVRPPDLLVSGDAKLVAARVSGGGLRVEGPAGMVRDTWLRRTGLAPVSAEGSDAWRCDAEGCVLRRGGQIVAVPEAGEALSDDCNEASAVIARLPVRGRLRQRLCGRVPLLLDRFDLWRSGTHALWLSPEGIRVETVGAERGLRPWAWRPPPAARRPNAPAAAVPDPSELSVPPHEAD